MVVKEGKFRVGVRHELEKLYGKGKVDTELYLPRTGRYLDIYVDDVFPLAIEVENDFESVFEGVGQSLLYAHETDAIPVIVVPEGEIEEPEREILNNYVNIIEIEV